MILKNYEKAKEYLLNGLKVDSLSPYLYRNLARLSTEIKEYQKSIEYFSKAIELAPYSELVKRFDELDVFIESIVFERTTPYENLEMYAEAEQDYLKAIELDPEDESYYSYLGNLYKDELKEPEKAIAQYLKILDLNPQSKKALINIALTYLDDLKNYDRAEEYFFKAIKADSLYARSYFALGRLCKF